MTLLYFLATIVLLVVIHEWGHFATARFFGVGVRSFTVGFGKQCVSWVDPKTGTSWGIAPFPVGGYVGLLGEKEAGDTAPNPAVTGGYFMQAPLHAKLCILFAGPLVNLVFAALLYSILAYSAPNPALPRLAAPALGSPAAAAGLQSGDVIDTLNGVAIVSWRNVQTELLALSAGDSLVLETAAGQRRALTLPALKPQQSPEDALGLRLYSKGLLVQATMPNSAAAKAGLQARDVMVRINGSTIDHPHVLLAALQAYKAGAPPLAIDVQRGERSATAYVSPELDAKGLYKMGVQFAGLPVQSEQATSAWAATQDGFATAYTASVLTVKAFGAFLLKPFNSEQLAGPITIAQTAKASADRGWMSAVAFVAGLSISVGVLNLLPVPLLDGGQIVYHTLSRLMGMLGLRFKIAHENRLSQLWVSVGVASVLLLTALAFFTDFKRLFDL